MILGVVSKTSGSFSWFGQGEDYKLRKNIGAILEQPNFYPFLSARQNLIVHSRIKDIRNPDFDGLLKMVGLFERANDPFKTYSLGMKQRLAIASAMLADPEVLIFDEPTNGLDPQGIAEIRKIILNIRDMEKSIVLASHLLDEVQKVCSHFAVLRHGKKIYSGSVEEALNTTHSISVGANNMLQLKQALTSCSGIRSMEEFADSFRLQVDERWTTAKLNKYLVERNIEINYIEQKRSSLEEKFLEILSEDHSSPLTAHNSKAL